MKILFLILLYLLFALPARAGGGLVYFEVSPQEIINPGESYTVTAHAFIDTIDGTPCKQCPAKFLFTDSGLDGNISQQESKTNDRGEVSAAISNKTEATRTILLSLDLPDGTKTSSSAYLLTFGVAQLGLTPVLTEIHKVGGIKVTGEVPFDSEKGIMRRVFVEWQQVPGDVVYYVYSRYEGADVDMWSYSGDSITPPYTTLNLRSDLAWDIKVQTCPRGNTEGCVDSDPIFLPKSDGKLTVTSAPNPELEKRITSLEEKVQQAVKKQTFLEAQVETIISFLKRIFPFWK